MDERKSNSTARSEKTETKTPPFDPAEVLVEHWPAIRNQVSWFGRTRHLSPEDIEDLASRVTLKLVENDYEVIRRFEGRSRFSTYVGVIVMNECRDMLIQRIGKWRPSRAATQLGPVAIELESLLYRERLGFDASSEILKSKSGGAVTDAQLEEIAKKLPVRKPRAIGLVPGEIQSPWPSGDSALVAAGLAEVLKDGCEAVRHAIAALEPEDRRVVELFFFQDTRLVDIARRLKLPQGKIYRRMDRILRDLRRALLPSGIDTESLRRALLSVGEIETSAPRTC